MDNPICASCEQPIESGAPVVQVITGLHWDGMSGEVREVDYHSELYHPKCGSPSAMSKETTDPKSILKPAVIEVCHAGHDYKFRCPVCESLNVNGLDADEVVCPDCGQKVIMPEVTMCDCMDNSERG